VERFGGLLTGEATFVGDLHVPGMLHLAYVRSPHASARIVSIDAEQATALPGVVAVFAAADLPILPLWEIALVPQELAQPALADGVVRYVGERVVAVVADSLATALDAAERVVVEYDELPAVTATVDGTRPGTPVVFAGRADNVCLSWSSDEVAGAFDGAGVSVTVDHRIPRLSVAPMEGHAVLAVPGADGRLTMWVSTQVPTASHRQICRSLGLDPAEVRVIAPSVGGGFGGKAAGAMPDHMIAGAAALALRRPVRFVEDRHANLSTMQGRGVRSTVEMHATGSGELIGMQATIVADAGAYPNVGSVEPGKTRMMLSGPYRMRAVQVGATAVMTNLPPVGAYRGPGRSEASVMLERSLDVLAADLGIDPIEIRRRNILLPVDFPHLTPTGVEYDSGDYAALLDRTVETAGYDALRRDQLDRRRRGGLLLGIGVSLVVDSTAWFSRLESAAVRVESDGSVVVLAGTASAGQQHEVVYRRAVRSVLPVAPEHIRIVEGDTDAWVASDGTMGSRSTQLGGSAVLGATEVVVAHLRELAAAQLEAATEDVVVYEGGRFGVRGVPSHTRTLEELVAAEPSSVEATCAYEQPGPSYPAAAHLAVVEVDVDTGLVVPVRHVAVTDCGRVIDAPSARAQVTGATVQGIAQALYEEAVFDERGNPRNPSFADYAIPSAAEVPMIETHFLESPSPRNPLGAKGVGEIGMLAAPVAVQNAVVDAVRHLGVRHIDMPCTPEKVWTAVHAR